jgi:hypothetical protein
MNQTPTPAVAPPSAVFARIAAGSLWTLLAFSAVIALLFALGAKTINMAGGWGWLFAAALIIALAVVVCVVCAIASAISLIRQEPHRVRSIGFLVVCSLIIWSGKDTAIHVVGGLHEMYQQLRKEVAARAERANPAAPKPVHSIAASDVTTLALPLLEHFRQRGFVLKPSSVSGERVEWLVENINGGPGCTVQTGFVRFPDGTPAEAMKKHLGRISSASELNEREMMAMFYPSARHHVRDGNNCDAWGPVSGQVTARLVDAFKEYNLPPGAADAAVSR